MSIFKQISLLFHRAYQALLTFVRGIALEGEEPFFTVTPLMVFGTSLGAYVASVGIAQGLWNLQQPWLYAFLLPTFALGQSASWTLYMDFHLAMHRAISRKAWVNAAVAEIASIVGMTIPPSIYKKKHNGAHHNSKVLATVGDPDYRWLQSLGFVPGKPIEYYWRLLWITLFDPMYYANAFVKRCRMNLVEAPLVHRLGVMLWWIAVIGLAFYFQLWAALIMYLVIIIIGYQISALLQTLSEHRWGYTGDSARKTFPRLLPIDKHPEMFFIYLYWQAAVLSTDLALHQLHHSKPRNFDWPIVAYSQEAQRDLDSAVWGIKAHFVAAFTSLSEAEAE